MALIGLLPGTFDPIHRGHVALAQAARRAGDLDEVWLLVDPQPAFKANVLPYEQRFAMTALATVNEDGVSSDSVPETVRALPHTMAGFAEVMRRRPDDRFVFVVGVDMLGRLDTWEDYAAIVKTAAFLAACRPGDSEEVIAALRKRLGPLGDELKVQLFEFGEEYGEASSTRVRQELREGGRPAMLAPSVHEYILKHGLYLIKAV